MLAGHIAHGGNISGEAKAGYRRANDKGQWWEAGASDKGGHMEVKNKRLAERKFAIVCHICGVQVQKRR